MALSWTWLVPVFGMLMFYYLQKNVSTTQKDAIVLNRTYDYMIVGAGSAGCVLVNRISEDLLSTVLIVDAGGSEDENEMMHVPVASRLFQNTTQDWTFKTVPQKESCMGLKDQKCAWPRGKVLGGSSSINYMHYMRGSRHDFDGWAKEGYQGWSYKDGLPYFIKLEDIQIPSLKNSDYHGRGGPLTVSYGKTSPLSDRVYIRGMEELGYKTEDCNGESQTGFCFGQETVRNGDRWRTAKAFLRPAMNHPNHHVTTNSYVTKVLIENKKAVGISFIREIANYVINAT